MVSSIFLTRIVLRNYKSIASCDVTLGPLTYLVGANGAGKSNFIDALHFVRDALSDSLDNALRKRFGISEVRRRSGGHPTHTSIRLEFTLRDGVQCHYSFTIRALSAGGYDVQREKCVIGGIGKGPIFELEDGKIIRSSEESFPAVTADRLALVSASGMKVFRPAYDALTSMGFYNFNPKLIRDLQNPEDGRLLRPEGENISSVLRHLKKSGSENLEIIEEYLKKVAPNILHVEPKAVGHKESLEFRQSVAGSKDPWHFMAMNMSDGTLRALGVLTALFQGNKDYSPSLIGIEEPETALHPSASAALREALERAAEHTQIIVTSHSPDLLDDRSVSDDSILAVVSEEGNTKIAPLDGSSRKMMRNGLFSAGELLRLDQLMPDRDVLDELERRRQFDFFAD